MSKPKHLLFDCDGVLVDTEFTAATKMTEALNTLGIDITINYYLQNFSGTTFSSIIHHYFEAALNTEEVLSIVNRVENEVARDVRVIEGVEDMLSNVLLAKSVVSNSAIKTVEHALKSTGLTNYFSPKVFSSELVTEPKPSPEVYQLAINSLRCQPDEILVIEDSESGVLAARSAGLKVVGFLGGSHILSDHGEKLRALGVSSIVYSMEELKKLLLRI